MFVDACGGSKAQANCESRHWLAPARSGLRIPDGRLNDVLEQLIAVGEVPVGFDELAHLHAELVPIAVRVLRRGRARIQRAVAVVFEQDPIPAGSLLGAENCGKGADVLGPWRRGLSEPFLVLDQPFLVGFLLPGLDGVSAYLDELHGGVLIAPRPPMVASLTMRCRQGHVEMFVDACGGSKAQANCESRHSHPKAHRIADPTGVGSIPSENRGPGAYCPDHRTGVKLPDDF